MESTPVEVRSVSPRTVLAIVKAMVASAAESHSTASKALPFLRALFGGASHVGQVGNLRPIGNRP